MTGERRGRPWWVIVGACLLLPPVGLVLIWIEPRAGLVRRLSLTLLALVVGTVYLFLLTDLRLEVDGSGVRPLISRYDPDRHFERLEASREAQGEESAATDASGESSDRAAEGAWPGFRGARRDGVYRDAIRTDWPPAGLPLLWRQPVGGGYASFAIADGHAITIEQRRQQEVVASYEVDTGREVWTHGWDAYFTEVMGGPGPRATPTWADGRLYALGANGELRCLRAADGELLWRRDILRENGATNLQWAMAASPLVVEGLVIVQPGGVGGRSIVAYDRLSGEPIWTSLDDVQSYTSPMLVTLGGRRQLLVVTAQRAAGLAIGDGSLLWEYPWPVSNVPNISQPLLIGDDRIFLSASYGKGSALLRVDRSGNGFSAETVWESSRMKNKQSGSVLHRGYIYGLDERILTCLDAATGELIWKGGRYGYGQLLLAGDHLVILAESGELALVDATAEGHNERARFPAIDGKTWNPPAIADGRLLVRNATEMAAFDISPLSGQ